MKFDDEFDWNDDDPSGPFHPVLLFLVALAGGAVVIAGGLFAYDIFTRFVPFL